MSSSDGRPTDSDGTSMSCSTAHEVSSWSDFVGCAVSNHIRRFKRPGYIAHRDFTPIQCLPDDCLLRAYDVPLPWKDGTPKEELEGNARAA